MSQVRRHLNIGISLLIAALFALNCARGSQTKFSKNLEADAGKAAPTYDEWVGLLGQERTDQLFAGVGQDSLNVLAYGIGQSNVVQLIEAITASSGALATNKFITLLGNDFTVGTGPGARTGLGSILLVYLLKSVDTQNTTTRSTNLVACATNTPLGCGDGDTITNVAGLVNNFATIQDVQEKIVELFGAAGFNVSRGLSSTVTGTAGQPALTFTPALQVLVVDRMAKLIGHVDRTTSACNKICTIMTGLVHADIKQKLAPMVTHGTGLGINFADKLVETIETVTATTNLVQVIQGVSVTNITGKLLPIIETVSDCTKMGYVINNVTSIPTLINILNNVQVPVSMGNLLNIAEDGATTWAGKISPTELWGSPTKEVPSVPTFAAATVTVTFNGASAVTAVTVTGANSGYLPGTAITAVATCTVPPSIRLNILGGVIQTTGHSIATNGTGCAASSIQNATVTNGTLTAIPRLVAVINGITPAADYYKLLGMVDQIGSMTKMVQLVQDVDTIGDVTQLLNNTAGGATFSGAIGTGCTVPNGTDAGVSATVGTGLSAVSFNAGSGVSYIRVLAGGSGYTNASAVTVPGCAGVTYNVTTSAGAITKIEVNNTLNNMINLVENMGAANMSRLVAVLNGQRAYDNTGNQQPAITPGTYLYKMTVLLNALSQPLEGPLKVGDLLNGVTLPDKIIDLIYNVGTTTNLAAVINGIFKSSTLPGCSDGSAGTLSGTPASNPNAQDTGTCENSGAGYFYGERDTAVTTLVYLVENVASSAKLVLMIDNITPANVIALVNHSATYSQHADGTTHVYPRGGTGLDPQAAGKKLAKIVDNTTTIGQLIFVTNNVSSIIKMAKLVSFMDIGAGPTDGVGKLPVLINAVGGTNAYLSTTVPGRGNPSGNATGMGKMVNVIDFIAGINDSATMLQLRNLMNNVNDINKMADLINQTVNSSNIVGLLNAVVDPRYNPAATTADMVTLLNTLPRGEVGKLVSLIGEIGSATGTATQTFPGEDHKLIAQLMSPATLVNSQATVTISIATPGVVSWAGHTLVADDSVIFTTTGALPTGIVAGQAYFVSATGLVAGTSFRISSVKGGALVNTSGTQSGVHTANAYGPTSTSGLGVADMSELLGNLNTTGGTLYASTFNLSGATMAAGGGTGASADAIVSPAAGTISKITVTAGGTFPGIPTGVTLTLGGGTGATANIVASLIDGGPNYQVRAIYVTNGGSGYTGTPTFTYSGSTPSVPPTVVVERGGLIGFSIASGGTGYTDSFTLSGATMSAGGGTGASAKALVAGPLNTTTGLTSFSGGSGYVNNQICPIIGAGGSGGTCQVQVTAGSVTGCSAIVGGTGYIDDQVVVIGGAATAQANVTAGSITGFTITNSGCGYAGATVSVRLLTGPNECTGGGAYSGTITGGVLTGITGAGATGCPANPTVIIGDSPYAAHGDNATAVVDKIVGGAVVAMSISASADNMAQLLATAEKAPLYNAMTYAGAIPNISAREGMVRLLKYGTTTIDPGWAAGYYNFTGSGSVYIARDVMGGLIGPTRLMDIVGLLGSDSTGLEQFPVLMGCLDKIQYGTTLATSFYQGCTTHSPSLWP
jgi:hypothetical protein